jgi:glycosyltransferase involved in cell wall biosynthesis
VRVLYDYQAFLQRQGGVSRYYAELIAALENQPGFEAQMPPFFSDNEYLHNGMTLVTHHHFKGKERIMGALNLLSARRALERPFDVFHPTYYRPYFLGRLKRPFVLTVHDMIHEAFGGEQVRDDGTARNKLLLCQRAARIIAVSQSTKNDLCRLLAVPEGKVTVIHHATNLRYRGEPRVHRQSYLLYVGARSGYKNFGRFIEAAATVGHRHDVQVVCAGGGPLTGAEERLIGSHGLTGRIVHYASSSAEELANLYHFAAALCYPSLYEGFGIPLLEAFACGCPVAASDCSSIPEVAGEAAVLFDPRSAASIADSLDRIISDPARRGQLVEAGARRLQAFSWEASARKTLAVYREAL